jgi:short-subunit dehydrogenase
VAKNDKTKLFQRGVADAAPVALHAYRAIMAGKVVAIPGLMNKLIAQSIRIAPRAWLRAISAGLNRKRK